MTSVSFSFNKIQRSYFGLELKNGKKITLCYPTKKQFDELLQLSEMINERPSEETFNLLTKMISKIMNRNLQSVEVEEKMIADDYDVEEQIMFLKSYMDFIGTLQNDPN